MTRQRTVPILNGAYSRTQFVHERSTDVDRAGWSREIDDENDDALREWSWRCVRDVIASCREITVRRRQHDDDEEECIIVRSASQQQPSRRRGCSSSSSSSSRDTIERILKSLSSSSGGSQRGPRWRPLRHIAVTSACCNDENDYNETAAAAGAAAEERNMAISVRDPLDELVDTFRAWIQPSSSSSSEEAVAVAAVAVNAETFAKFRRLIDVACLDSVRYTVSPECNRDIAEAAGRNARIREEFSRIVAKFGLSETIAAADADADAAAAPIGADALIVAAADASSKEKDDVTNNATRSRRNSLSTDAAVAAIAWNMDNRRRRHDETIEGDDDSLPEHRGVKRGRDEREELLDIDRCSDAKRARTVRDERE